MLPSITPLRRDVAVPGVIGVPSEPGFQREGARGVPPIEVARLEVSAGKSDRAVLVAEATRHHLGSKLTEPVAGTERQRPVAEDVVVRRQRSRPLNFGGDLHPRLLDPDVGQIGPGPRHERGPPTRPRVPPQADLLGGGGAV